MIKSRFPGSPFILDIADANSVSVYGDNLRMAAVDRPSNFMVHAVGAESKDLSVVITGQFEPLLLLLSALHSYPLAHILPPAFVFANIISINC